MGKPILKPVVFLRTDDLGPRIVRTPVPKEKKKEVLQ